jgi:hypothetical protein
MYVDAQDLAKLTGKLPTIASRENNARILGIAVSGIGEKGIRDDAACDMKAAMVIELHLW